MKIQELALTGMVLVALAAAGCAPAVDNAATETAMEARHAAETQTSMDDMHMAETETAREALHAAQTQTAAGSGEGALMRMSGAFYNLQHAGSGEAVLVGSMEEGYVLKLQGFAVEAGPDLHVVLTAAETVAADDTALPDAIDLGLLAATSGDLEIPVPAGTDVSAARSVVVWCQTFSVAFIAAPLAP